MVGAGAAPGVGIAVATTDAGACGDATTGLFKISAVVSNVAHVNNRPHCIADNIQR